ncbi:hypothetical protein GCM10027059_45770 [Myceligenerans halotolerans]
MTTGKILDGWDDGAFYDTTDPRDRPRIWQVGDRVVRVEGPPILLGSTGTVVEVDVPGLWPIRVEVDGRIGFGQVLASAEELAPDEEATASTDNFNATAPEQDAGASASNEPLRSRRAG